jgi:hypothetical protein
MRKFIALFLVISFLGMNCATYERGEGINLSPDQKPGEKLVIQKTDGQKVRGELIAVKQNSLLLKESESGVDVNVEISEIKMIKIVNKPNFLAGVYGFIGGAALGATLGFAGGDDPPGWFSMTASDKALLAGSFFGLIGLIVGAIGGLIEGIDYPIKFEGRSDSEIKDILKELRKKARIPDFQ